MSKLQDQILDILSSSMDTATALAESNRIIAEAKTSAKPLTYYTKDGKQFTLAQGKVAEQQARQASPAAKPSPVTQTAKEPWEMSKAEFAASARRYDVRGRLRAEARTSKYGSVDVTGETPQDVTNRLIQQHLFLVEDAVLRKRPVPASVLTEYKNEPWAAKANPTTKQRGRMDTSLVSPVTKQLRYYPGLPFQGRAHSVVITELAKAGWRYVGDSTRKKPSALLIKEFGLRDVHKVGLPMSDGSAYTVWIGRPSNEAGKSELKRLTTVDKKLPWIPDEHLPASLVGEYVMSKADTEQRDAERKRAADEARRNRIVEVVARSTNQELSTFREQAVGRLKQVKKTKYQDAVERARLEQELGVVEAEIAKRKSAQAPLSKAESGQSAAYDKASAEYRRLYDEWESALKNFKKTGVGGDRVKELQAQLDPALDRVDALFVSRNPWERVGNPKYDSLSKAGTSETVGKPSTSELVVLSGAQFRERGKELEAHPNWKVANDEYSTKAAQLVGRERAAIARLNKAFTGALGNSKSKLSANRLNIHHDAVNRKFGKRLLDLRLSTFRKYGLGDVPVEEWRYRDHWLDATNPKVAKLDKLRIQSDKAHIKFSDSIGEDIRAAGGPSNLRYMKEGELDGFSDRTRELYREGKRLASQIAKLEGASPIETPVSSLQSIESSRSELSRTSDERQSHSLIVEPDDPRVSRWERDPGSMDIQGVDTPKHKSKYAVGKSKSGKTKKKRAAKGFTSLGTTR